MIRIEWEDGAKWEEGRGVGSKVVKMQMQVSPEKLPAVTPFPSPKRFQIDESPPYVEFPVLVRWQHRGGGWYVAVYYPRGGTWLYRVPISTEMVDGGWRSLNRGEGSSQFVLSKPRVVGCWIGAREINKISIRSLYDTFSRTSLGHQRKIVIGSLKNVRSALYADYGMLCQECFQRVRWRVRDAYKCRLRRASECAGRRRTSRYTRVSNHRADIWQGRKGSLSFSLSREDLIKFFWPRRFILKTIPLLFRSDNPDCRLFQ